ncbi:ABC transporter ATP-binding protein [Amycolatopsis aidingensis]|uniref:ABC transporter ATP-binding protein n=1 Tax=Amycolatopsis aidingensis TaxID=2842453 RepID=UPI001C0AB6D1|nr:ABC transporter ATP-binding protein [Amycolatopsis aidingensis]
MTMVVENTPATRSSTVELTGVSHWYGNVVAVNDITLTVGPGVTGLLGPNGAGKTTVLHMMAGFLRPAQGTVHLDGKPTWRDPEVYRKLGLVTERESVPGFLTAREFVLSSAKLHGLKDPAAATAMAIDIVELGEAKDRKISTYSKGMRQRARVAAALVHEPSVLMLDEPFNGMDPRQRLHMMDLLHRMAEEGRTILFSSHILEEVEQLSGTIQVIVAGRLAASGHYRHIRKLMTNRPSVYLLRSSNDRRLGTVLMGLDVVSGVELEPAGLQVRTSDSGTFTRALAKLARAEDIRLTTVQPSDDSLENVFSYLVAQ